MTTTASLSERLAGVRHTTLADGLRYGLLGAPLAFAALPLYVLLPSHYAAQLGVPLAALGLVLLAARALDALVDPWIGRWVDRQFAGPRSVLLGWAWAASLLLAIGFAALFFPPFRSTAPLLAWCGAALVITYLGYSTLGVLHQAWGARLGGNATAQARIVGWREGLSLAGVLTASVLPALAGIGAMVATCAAGLALGVAALAGAPRGPARSEAMTEGPAAASTPADDSPRPLREPAFRRLLAVFLANGIASAIPATLVLFFIRDRLDAAAFEPVFLGGYFAAGALSVPLWVRAVARFGLVRCWLMGMALSIAAFIWAAALANGDVGPFLLVCIASGAALGSDLVVPGALLAGVIRRAGHACRLEGTYFGWWNCAGKLNLALAAGLALPALQALGYQAGARDEPSLAALVVCYAILPCILKALAAALLWRVRTHLE